MSHSQSDSDHEQPTHQPRLDLTLTSTLSRVAFQIVPEGLSEDGSLIYVYYVTTFPFPENPLEVELFANDHGQLTSIGSISSAGDPFFVNGGSIDDGGANHTYTLFTVIDDNGTGTGRIRLFNFLGGTFNLLATTLVSNVVATSMGGGFFSHQSEFIVVTYTDSTNNNLVTLLLSTAPVAGALPILNSFSIVGTPTLAPITNNPALFHLVDKKGITHYYYLLGFANTVVGSTPLQYQAPARLNVYEIIDYHFVMLDSATLNQFPTSYFPFNPFDREIHKTKIIVSTNLALRPTQPSVYLNTGNTQSLTGDDENLVQFSFDGKKLKRTVGQRFDTTLIAGNYSRDGRTFSVGTYNTNNLPTQLSSIVLLRGHHHQGFESVARNIFVTGPPAEFSPLFSGNGRWFLVCGGSLLQNDGVTQGLNNIAIYRVNEC